MPGIILEDVDGSEDVDSTVVLNVTVIHGRIAASKFLLEGGRYLPGKTEKSLLFEGGYKSIQKVLGMISYAAPDNWHGSDIVYISIRDRFSKGLANTTLYVEVKSVIDPPVLNCSNKVLIVDEDSKDNVVGECEILCPEHVNSVHELHASARLGLVSLPSRNVDTLRVQRKLVQNIKYTPESNTCGEDVVVIAFSSGSRGNNSCESDL